MTYEEALEHLVYRVDATGIHDGFQYMDWAVGDEHITLDSSFSLVDLEAIVAVMREHKGEEPLPREARG